jgi:hypothetical protein
VYELLQDVGESDAGSLANELGKHRVTVRDTLLHLQSKGHVSTKETPAGKRRGKKVLFYIPEGTTETSEPTQEHRDYRDYSGAFPLCSLCNVGPGHTAVVVPQAVVFAAASDLGMEMWPTKTHPIGDAEGRGRTKKEESANWRALTRSNIEQNAAEKTPCDFWQSPGLGHGIWSGYPIQKEIITNNRRAQLLVTGIRKHLRVHVAQYVQGD